MPNILKNQFTPEEIKIIFFVALAISTMVLLCYAYFLIKLLRSKQSPYKYIKELLSSSIPLEISSPFSIEEASERLKGELSIITISVLTPTCITGYVRANKFSINLHQRFYSGQGLILYGTISRSKPDGQTILKGNFQIPTPIRWFMTIWFNFIMSLGLLMIPLGILGLLFLQWEAIIFLIAPVGMVALGVGMMKLLLSTGSKHRQKIAELIAQAVGGSIRTKI